MAEGLKSTCTVMDPLGQRCNVSVKFHPSIIGNWFDKSDQLMALIQTYSLGTVTGRSDNMSHGYATPDRGAPAGPYGTVDQKAVIILKETNTGTPRRIEIPAPMESMFTYSEENGWRVKGDIGKAIATSISAMGVDVSFVRGWLKSKQ